MYYVTFIRPINSEDRKLYKKYIDIGIYTKFTTLIDSLLIWEVTNQKVNTKISLIKRIFNPDLINTMYNSAEIEVDVFILKELPRRMIELLTIIKNDFAPTMKKLVCYQNELISILNSYIELENNYLCKKDNVIRIHGIRYYDCNNAFSIG